MNSFIYRSEKKADCYIFMKLPTDTFDLPKEVSKVVGELHFVMELEITHETKLAISDASKVLKDLESQGFYIQMPSSEPHPVDILFNRLV